MAETTQPYKIREFPPTIKHLVRSKEYLGLSPTDRMDLARDFMQASPEQQTDFLQGLTYANPIDKPLPKGPSLPQNLRDAGAQVVDAGAQIVGAGLGKATGIPGGGVLGEVLGSVGGDRLNRALGLKDPKQVVLPTAPLTQAINPTVQSLTGQTIPSTVSNEPLTGPLLGNLRLTPGDVAAAATPLGFRVAGGVAKLLTKPAQQAVAHADLEDAANKQQYQTGVNEVANTTQRKIGQAQEKAVTDLESWKQRGQVLDREFKADMAKIRQDAATTNAQKDQAYLQRQQEYQQARATHTQEAARLQQMGTTAPPGEQMFEEIGGHGPLYDQAQQTAQTAKPVDTTPFRKAAKDLKIDFEQPAEGVQSPFKNIVSALQGFGAPVKPQSTASPILDAFGAPITTQTPGNTGAQPLERVMATQRELGRLIGKLSKTKGQEYHAAQELYGTIDDMLTAQRNVDPAAAQAIDLQLEANRRYMRSRAAEDWESLWYDSTKPLTGGQVEVNAQALRNGLRDLETNNRFWNKAWSPEERAHMHQVIDAAPQQGIPAEPQPEVHVDPTSRELTRTHTYQKASQRHAEAEPSGQADYSKIDYPSWPEPPEKVTPDLGRFPFGKFILTNIGAKELAARIYGVQGSMPAWGLGVALSLFGIPRLASKALLAMPGGEQMAREIVSGQRLVSPSQLAAITAYVKRQGGLDNVEE